MPAQLTPTRPSTNGKVVKYDDFIDAKIETTRRTVKLVDLATSLVAMAVTALAFLLVAAVIENWLIPGGFSSFFRFLLFALLMGGLGYIAYRRLWPLCVHAINPVYAAHT